MSFISPMLAASMPKTPLRIEPNTWALEEKLDGHRLVARVDLRPVTAWSRYGLERVLPSHITEALSTLPAGVYDGELLVPGKRSYGVTEIVNGPDLVFVVFDVLELLGVSTVAQTYDERRAYLREIEGKGLLSNAVTLSPSWDIANEDDVNVALKRIWAADGEGVILKRRASRYSVGKRPKGDWIKMKMLRSAVLTVVGFQASKGTIQNRGPFATVVLRDDEGYETTVKTLNDAECRRFEVEAPTDFMAGHPALGRRLRIEYQERTPDGSYRHPRWDRWAEEDE